MAGCEASPGLNEQEAAAEYAKCAAGVQIDVGMVEKDHVQGSSTTIAVLVLVVRTQATPLCWCLDLF